MAPVVIMFRIIFWALPAFMRVEPETTSAPTSATTVISAASTRAFLDCRSRLRCALRERGHKPRRPPHRACGRKPKHQPRHPCAWGGGVRCLAGPALRVFIDFDCGCQRLGPAGHDVLHLSGRGGIGGRALRCSPVRRFARWSRRRCRSTGRHRANFCATRSITSAISGIAFFTAAATFASSWLMMRAISSADLVSSP
jgi:hypothetical protein